MNVSFAHILYPQPTSLLTMHLNKISHTLNSLSVSLNDTSEQEVQEILNVGIELFPLQKQMKKLDRNWLLGNDNFSSLTAFLHGFS